MKQHDQDEEIEFLPSDEIVEPEPSDTEEEAVHAQPREESRGLMTVEAEEFDAEELDQDEAEELEIEAGEAVADEEAEAEAEEEHEEDLEEVLRRQFGIVGEEPDEDLARGEEQLPEPATGEFVCRSCFLRRPISQLSDAAHHTCVDCATNRA